MRKAIQQRLLGDSAERQRASTDIRPRKTPLPSSKQTKTVQNRDIQPQPSLASKDPQPNPRHHQDDVQAAQSDPPNGFEPKESIWAHAYKCLRASKPKLLAAFGVLVEEYVPSTASPQQRLSIAVAKRRDDMLGKQWVIRFCPNMYGSQPCFSYDASACRLYH